MSSISQNSSFISVAIIYCLTRRKLKNLTWDSLKPWFPDGEFHSNEFHRTSNTQWLRKVDAVATPSPRRRSINQALARAKHISLPYLFMLFMLFMLQMNPLRCGGLFSLYVSTTCFWQHAEGNKHNTMAFNVVLKVAMLGTKLNATQLSGGAKARHPPVVLGD